MQQHQHLVDWYRQLGFHVTVLTDGALMCLSEAAILTTDPDLLSDAVQRLHKQRLCRRQS